jgi:hypothetical protein
MFSDNDRIVILPGHKIGPIPGHCLKKIFLHGQIKGRVCGERFNKNNVIHNVSMVVFVSFKFYLPANDSTLSIYSTKFHADLQ